VRVSKQIRYRMCRLNEQSALYKQWESATLNSDAEEAVPLVSSRMFFSRNRGYPTALLSVIPYDNVEEKARQERKRAEVNRWLRVYKQPVRDWRGVSYKAHFQAALAGGGGEEERESSSTSSSGGGNSISGSGSGIGGNKKGLFGDHERGECFRHDPSLLDDPDMMQGG
jgi:hypothetical protein